MSDRCVVLFVALCACKSSSTLSPDAAPLDSAELPDARADARPDGPGLDAAPPPRICGDGVRDPGEVCFAPINPIAIGGAVHSARLVDVDRDGKLDLVYLTDTGIEIRIGDGAGHFGNAVSGPPTSARYLAPGDFDADGHVDVVTAGANDMTVWRNDGTSFALYATTALPRPATALVAADVDGYPGAEIAQGDFQIVSLWRVAGPNDLRLQTASAGNTQVLAHGNLNGDAYDDVLVGTDSSVDTLLGGNGGVVSGPSYPGMEYFVVHSSVTGIAIGDADGDGMADAIGAFPQPSLVVVAAGDAQSETTFDPACATGPSDVAQLDGMGGIELVLTCPTDHRVRVASANHIVRDVDLADEITGVHADGDVNGDGIADVVVTMTTSVVVLVSAPP